ncbi:Molybdate-binding periplasmic protein precursor [Aureliella helgolandensis]|uniref:Molybdate-binding periplasmic protein n=1 Tax=Aureliella helgolandensis TaxID=2527968 RepID=A0A518GA93_9BACT|nr:Molybdate-binding periplasmic protein precursor [Aureliella helgolandensis]
MQVLTSHRPAGIALACGCCLLLVSGCQSNLGQTPARQVRVLAAASTASAMEEIAEQFQQRHPGISIIISTGPSNGLTQQILAGAPADIFLPAHRQWAELLDAEGLSSRTVDLLSNHLVLIVPRGNPAQVQLPGDLLTDAVTKLVIAGEHVPAGIYAEQTLNALQLFAPLQSEGKLARGSDVRTTLIFVEVAEAEAGIVYATDAQRSDLVEVVATFDPLTYETVVYPAILLQAGDASPQARQFFDYLISSAGIDIFTQHGFASLDSKQLPHPP